MNAPIKRGCERAYMLGGSAIFTVENERSGGRFTYKVEKSSPAGDDQRPPVWFVSVLVGANNVDDYAYLGIITDRGEFRKTAASKVGDDAPSRVAFAWTWQRIDQLPPAVRVLHSGSCSKCGRLLTTPQSIELGLGPICAGRAA